MDIEAFKKRAQRAQAYFESKGLNVPHTAVLEALAHYEGHRSYKALRGSMSKPKAGARVLEKGQKMGVLVRNHACSPFTDGGWPEFTLFEFTRDNLKELEELVSESRRRLLELSGDMLAYEFIGGDWRLSYHEGTVSAGEFWAGGTEKYTDGRFESAAVSFERLCHSLSLARKQGASLVLYGFEAEQAQAVIAEALDCDEQADYRSSMLVHLAKQGHLTRPTVYAGWESLPG